MNPYFVSKQDNLASIITLYFIIVDFLFIYIQCHINWLMAQKDVKSMKVDFRFIYTCLGTMVLLMTIFPKVLELSVARDSIIKQLLWYADLLGNCTYFSSYNYKFKYGSLFVC